MSNLKTDKARDIIVDFASEIKRSIKRDGKPSVAVIPFRDDRQKNRERSVVEVRTELLRFRKENGRISSDVMSYEKDHGFLKEDTQEAQKILKEFLYEKDKEKTSELVSSIMHGEQRDPAVVTSDGFLINGNRRKVAIEILFDKTKDEKYKWMKVVILPGEEDKNEGGPPTIIEIEQLENRYQLQSEGKAEYYGFDQALSIRRKIQRGIDLRELLKDDPSHALLTEKELDKVVKNYEEKYLNPLDCVDQYLGDYLHRENDYKTVSAGRTDREGRWQAFLDYSSHVSKKIHDENFRIKNGINEDEVGEIEEVAFSIIRKRDFHDLPKLHMIMRKLPKWLGNPSSKKELIKILDSVEADLPDSEKYDKDGNELSERDKDKKWSALNQETLERQVKKAKSIYEQDLDKETTLMILEAALKKLNQDQLKPENIASSDAEKAMKLCGKIEHRSNELGSIFYQIMKKPEKLIEKFGKKRKNKK